MTLSSTLSAKALHRTEPAYVETFGPEVASLCDQAGFAPDYEQKQALNALFGIGPDGLSSSFEFAMVGPRQNLKTGTLKMATIGWLFVTDQDLVTWSAHEMPTTAEAFRDLKLLIEGYAPFRRRLATGTTNGIYEGNGNWMIELASGQRLKFRARTKVGGRGLTGNKVVLDEAMYLLPSHLGSLLPTLAVVRDPQVAYAGSAGLLRSAEWRQIRERGRGGADPKLTYIEYGTPAGGCATEDCDHRRNPRPPGCALDNEEKRAQANPSYGGRLKPERLEDFRRSMPPDEFAREFLSWWEDPPEDEDGDAVSMTRWSELADPEAAAPTGSVALALAVPPDRSSTSISATWEVDGRIWVMVTELVGTARAAAKIGELVRASEVCDVSLHAGGPAGSLIPAIEAELQGTGLELRTVSTQEAAQATGAFIDLIAEPKDEDGKPTREKLLGHLDQVELNYALDKAKLRKSGDNAQLWDQTDPTNRAPLIAVTLGTNGYLKHGRDSFFGGGWR